MRSTYGKIYICVCVHIYIYMCVFFFYILFHYRLFQDVEYNPLCYTVGRCWLSVLYIAVYICQCYFLSLSRPLLPLLCPQAHPLCLHLYSCPVIFIYTIFPDSTYMHLICIICFSYAHASYMKGKTKQCWHIFNIFGNCI